MNRITRNLITLAIAIAALTGCNRQFTYYHLNASTSDDCILIAPGADDDPTANDAFFADFANIDYSNDTWTNLDTGEVIGYSIEEDSDIFNSINCI